MTPIKGEVLGGFKRLDPFLQMKNRSLHSYRSDMDKYADKFLPMGEGDAYKSSRYLIA